MIRDFSIERLQKDGLMGKFHTFSGISRMIQERVRNNIHFSCKFNEEARGYIAISIKDIEDNSCVKFRPANIADLDWIEIDDNGEGCFATLGFIGPGAGKHTLNLNIGTSSATCITKGVIVHELLHILGVSHEQVRPDRDNYMTVNWPNMKVIF